MGAVVSECVVLDKRCPFLAPHSPSISVLACSRGKGIRARPKPLKNKIRGEFRIPPPEKEPGLFPRSGFPKP